MYLYSKSGCDNWGKIENGPQIKEPCGDLAIKKGNMKFDSYIKIIKFYQLVSAKTMDKNKKKERKKEKQYGCQQTAFHVIWILFMI